MKYLLDTTELIKCFRGDKNTVKLLQDLVTGGHSLGCCCINICEVYYGMKPEEKDKTDKLIDSLFYFDLSREAAKLAGTWRREYQNKGFTITLNDALIASVAYLENAVLITSNKKDFPMTEITIL